MLLVELDRAVEEVHDTIGCLRGRRVRNERLHTMAEAPLRTVGGTHHVALVKGMGLTSFISMRCTEPSTSVRVHSGVFGSALARVKVMFFPDRSVSYSPSVPREIGDFCRSIQRGPHAAATRFVSGGEASKILTGIMCADTHRSTFFFDMASNSASERMTPSSGGWEAS